jgi:hypothetical protein
MISAAPTGNPNETWFHQHFAISSGPFRVFNFTGSSAFGTATGGQEGDMVAGVGAEITDGGRAIPYHLEDPFLRKHFEERLKENNGRFDMPEEVYTEAGANIKVMSD